MNRLTVTLPAELDEMVKDHVQNGVYASNSEVVRDALRYWRDRDEVRLASIKRRIEASIDDPRPRISNADMRTQMGDFVQGYEVKGDA